MYLSDILKEMGEEAELRGDTNFDSLSLAAMRAPGRALTFLDTGRFAAALSDRIAVVLTTTELEPLIQNRAVCVTPAPRLLFFRLHNFLAGDPDYVRKPFQNEIGEGCEISPLAHIAPKNVKIGKRTVIEEFVSIKENVTIGDDCVIRAGTVVGGEGFEQKRAGETVLSVKHLGGVVIGNHVELQQNNTVDKAIYPWDDTEIGDWCRTDNLVHIAHEVKMKRCVMIAACTCIAGRVTLEDNVWIGPGVTVINGITVGRNGRVNIGSVATRDVPENGAVTGNFALEHGRFIRNLKLLDAGELFHSER